MDHSTKFCVIGAGASGLAVAKNFKLHAIPFDCLEREADLGGLWNIATKSGVVYETTHLVSAATSTWFDDYPMDEAMCLAYPSHAQILDYFRGFVRHFELAPHIAFGCSVQHVAPRADTLWDVTIAGENRPRVYRGVVLANGHHHVPRMPSYPGRFAGEILHSSAYRSPRQLRDKRILVVGAGNSACDIARDAAHSSGSIVTMSFRRGYWFIPKFLLGFPTHDVVTTIETLPMPNIVRRIIFEVSLWVLQGPPSRYRLPDPDHHIDQAHPTMSDDIPRLAAHGRIQVKPEIERYDGANVVFKDDTSTAFDTVIFATGYKIEFPFIDGALVNNGEGRPLFFKHAFHPAFDTLFAAGLVQANGSIWRLADYQGRLMARFIHALDKAPASAAWFRRLKAAPPAAKAHHFVGSERHTLEANYFVYRRQLKRLTRGFGWSLARLERKVPRPVYGPPKPWWDWRARKPAPVVVQSGTPPIAAE